MVKVEYETAHGKCQCITNKHQKLQIYTRSRISNSISWKCILWM